MLPCYVGKAQAGLRRVYQRAAKIKARMEKRITWGETPPSCRLSTSWKMAAPTQKSAMMPAERAALLFLVFDALGDGDSRFGQRHAERAQREERALHAAVADLYTQVVEHIPASGSGEFFEWL